MANSAASGRATSLQSDLITSSSLKAHSIAALDDCAGKLDIIGNGLASIRDSSEGMADLVGDGCARSLQSGTPVESAL